VYFLAVKRYQETIDVFNGSSMTETDYFLLSVGL
jgi:hypothetical protein